MSMNAQQSRESFKARTERLRKGLADGVTGPLRMSYEVLLITRDWNVYKDEANMAVTQWVRSLRHGADLRFFSIRATAAERIGADAKRWDHEAAVWAIGRPQAQNDIALRALVKRVAQERAAGPPLGKKAVQRIARDLWGAPERAPSVSTCDECAAKDNEIARLRALLEEAGR